MDTFCNGIVDSNFNYSWTVILFPRKLERIYDGNGRVEDKEFVHVVVKDGVREIPSFAFNECKKLSNVELPSSVTKIGMSAFRRCSSLTKIDVPFNIAVNIRSLFLFAQQECQLVHELNECGLLFFLKK